MSADAPTPSQDARVVVLVRQGCHLCDEAVEVIASVCGERRLAWQAVDVDTDPALQSRWTDHVPVTFVDGEQHALWFVDPERLVAALG